MHSNQPLHFNLVAAAHAAMIEHGFQPDFPPGTSTELAAIQAQPAAAAGDGLSDLRDLLWSSIDNDTSKDLDQIEWAEQLPDGRIRVLAGDRVTLELSPYDLTKGRITYRHKA